MDKEMHAFSKDLVFYLLKQIKPDWEISDNYYSSKDLSSPFTDKMKRKLEAMCEEEENDIVPHFEKEFPYGVLGSRFQEVCEKYRNSLLHICIKNKTFDVEKAFKYFVQLTKLANLAICFKYESAPYVVVENIYKVFDRLKELNLLPENPWLEMENFCS